MPDYLPDECPECGEELYLFDWGRFRGLDWHSIKCKNCEWDYSNEPDYDSMPGGRDYY